MGYDFIERKKSVKEQNNYTDRRIDLLLITFSGATIYVVLEVIKYAKVNANLNISTDLPKLTGGLVIMTILINFLSLLSSKRTYRNDLMMCDEGVEDAKSTRYNKYYRRVGFWDGLTASLNVLSYFLLISALGLLCYYFFKVF